MYLKVVPVFHRDLINIIVICLHVKQINKLIHFFKEIHWLGFVKIQSHLATYKLTQLQIVAPILSFLYLWKKEGEDHCNKPCMFLMYQFWKKKKLDS